MKKAVFTILGLVFLTQSVFAGTITKTLISATTLDDDPTSVTSSTFGVQNYKKLGCYVNYDETEVGGISAAVTLDISYDGTNWIDASFHDYAGGATLQTSETLSSDGWYFCWLDPDTLGDVVRFRMVVTATGSDTDDTAVVAAYLVGAK